MGITKKRIAKIFKEAAKKRAARAAKKAKLREIKLAYAKAYAPEIRAARRRKAIKKTKEIGTTLGKAMLRTIEASAKEYAKKEKRTKKKRKPMKPLGPEWY